jgi:ubiquinone/menaquinone biosynthesis C-methylase UbiE
MQNALLGRSNFSAFPSLTPTIFMLKQQRPTQATTELDPLTARVRTTWTSGDFGRIARGYELGSAQFITRLGLSAGERVLDVATGTGNLAIPAARAGAKVTGVDIAPNLVTQAKARAAAEGLTIRLDVGDAEALCYDDDEFDTAVSMFGAMFAARPGRAAAELLRVVRSGGRIAMANWTPSSFIGEMLKITERYAPPPAGLTSPMLWGTEQAVRERLGTGLSALSMTHRIMTFEYALDPSGVVNEFIQWYGPTLRAMASLNDASRTALRAELEALWSDHNRATDGTTRVQSEYLEVVAVVK